MGAPKRDALGRVVKGSVLNPNGRAKEPAELKMLRKNMHNDIRIYALKVLGKPYDQLLEEHHNAELTVHEKMFVTCAEAAISDASLKHLELIYKIIGLNLNTTQTVRIEDEATSTGLEKIPTEKLERIQEILNGDGTSSGE